MFGIRIKYCFRWEDIANVINHKRYFSIEGQQENYTQFQFCDVETAKYVWNMCVLQVNYYLFFLVKLSICSSICFTCFH